MKIKDSSLSGVYSIISRFVPRVTKSAIKKNWQGKLGQVVCLTCYSIVLAGCAGSPLRLEADNTKNMISLKLGMSSQAVQNLMGPPQKSEMYRGKMGESVLTYHYLTNAMGYVDNPANETNWTPVILVNDSLVGWGWSQLDTTAKKYELVIKHR